MQDAKVFCSNLICILRFFVSVLSFLSVARVALAREKRAESVKESAKMKEITIGKRDVLTPFILFGAVLSLLGVVALAFYLWHSGKEK